MAVFAVLLLSANIKIPTARLSAEEIIKNAGIITTINDVAAGRGDKIGSNIPRPDKVGGKPESQEEISKLKDEIKKLQKTIDDLEKQGKELDSTLQTVSFEYELNKGPWEEEKKQLTAEIERLKKERLELLNQLDTDTKFGSRP